MPLNWYKCPDGTITTVKDCLSKCRMDERCLTLPTLTLIADERKWTGTPSTTQLLNGTMMEFLKITIPYCIDPDSRAFALLGSIHHRRLEEVAKEIALPAELALTPDGRNIFDLLEPEDGDWTLTDYKTWGSYRVVKALGIVEGGKIPDPSGEVYKASGKWGKAGTPKMVNWFRTDPSAVDLWETELQLNRYRIMLEEKGIGIAKMQIQITVRDGGLAIAQSRGITRNMYMIPIKRLPTEQTIDYFRQKALDLEAALQWGKWDTPCDMRECWDGARCKGYCEVADFCPKGILYQGGG